MRWFTCDGRLTLCDPIWQVTPRSSEMGSHKELCILFKLIWCGAVAGVANADVEDVEQTSPATKHVVASSSTSSLNASSASSAHVTNSSKLVTVSTWQFITSQSSSPAQIVYLNSLKFGGKIVSSLPFIEWRWYFVCISPRIISCLIVSHIRAG